MGSACQRVNLRDFVWLLCSCVNFACPITLAFALNALFHDWMTSFDTDRGQTAAVQAICIGVMAGTGVFAGMLERKLGPRMSMMVGGCVASLGLFSGAFARSLPILVVCVGIAAGSTAGRMLSAWPVVASGMLQGFGFCLVNLSAMSAGLRRYPKRAGFVSALMTSTSGVFHLGTSILYRYLSDKYSWRGCLIIASGLCLQTLILGLMQTSPVFLSESTSQRKSRTKPNTQKSSTVTMTTTDKGDPYPESNEGSTAIRGTHSDLKHAARDENEPVGTELGYQEKDASETDFTKPITAKARNAVASTVHTTSLLPGACGLPYGDPTLVNDTTQTQAPEDYIGYAFRDNGGLVTKSNKTLLPQPSQTEFGMDEGAMSHIQADSGTIEELHQEAVNDCGDTILGQSEGIVTKKDKASRAHPSQIQFGMDEEGVSYIQTDTGSLEELHSNPEKCIHDLSNTKCVNGRDHAAVPLDSNSAEPERENLLKETSVGEQCISPETEQKHASESQWIFLKNPLYLLVSLSTIISLSTTIGVLVLIVDFAISNGWTVQDGVFFYFLFQLTGLTGRFVTGIISLHRKVHSIAVLSGNAAFGAIALGILGQIVHYKAAAALFSALGFGIGGVISMFPAAILSVTGVRSYSLALGLTCTMEGVLDSFSGIITGFLVDVLGSYRVPCLVYGVVSLSTSILLVVMFKCCKHTDI